MKHPYEFYKHRNIPGMATDFGGYWITSLRFYHLDHIRKYGHNRLDEFNTEIQNVHTLFRKSFTLKNEKIKSALLYITGDDLYKLYVNSAFVGEGPAQSYPFSYNYNCYDVTDLMVNGENTIGVHIYYQGLFNIYLVSADNLCGMIAKLEIVYENGEKECVESDASWKYTETDAYSAPYTYGYQTQFSEDIDFRKTERGWAENGFDDKGWEKAKIAARPCPIEYNLVPQATPTVTHYPVYPTEIKAIDGGYLFDFGRENVGSPITSFTGKENDTVELRYGEELDGDGRVRYEIRAFCTYRDVMTLSGEEDLLEYFDYKGYRYMEILNPPKDFDKSSVYTLARNYPFPERSARFETSSELLNKIWDICAHGVKVGTQDTYYDCPTREKGGFLGDALITGLSHLILTADTKIYKKFITDCYNASRYCPAVMAHLPTYDINICADYSALVPLFLSEYYSYTADKAFIEEMMPMVEGVWSYYSEFLNDDGLLDGIEHMPKVPSDMCPILIDWPTNLRDGYDMDKAVAGVSTTVNTFFYGFLKTAAELYKIIGRSARADELTALYTKMGESLIRSAYDYESGLFKDAPDSEHSAIHANALQLFFGLTPPKGYGPIVELIRQRRLNCGVYFAYFVIKGLFNIGERDLAFDLLLGDDEHSWTNMVRSGATTCMEVWGPDQKWNTSWCHPWSSSPIYFYTSEIIGIKPTAPGMRSFKIEPHLPDNLDFARLDMPIPDGFISLEISRTESRLECTVSAPECVQLTFVGDGVDFKRKQ